MCKMISLLFLLIFFFEDEVSEDANLWLQNNIEPFSEVLQKWNITYTLRSNKFEIHEYYEKYKSLKSSSGYLLVSRLV